MIHYNDWGKHIRLGNFLFLYAGIQSIIKDSDNSIAFPDYFLWNYLKDRPYVTTDTNYEELFHFKSEPYSKQLKEFYKTYFKENKDRKININLGSHLQSEKWIKEDISYIKSKLAIREEEILRVKNKYSTFFTKSTIGIGIRRGDFVNHGIFYQIPETWYKKALDNNFDYNQYNVVVFSDDIEWCKKYYKNENFMYAEPNNTHLHTDGFKHYHKDPMEQFILASQMDNFIGGSSTFSWWNMWFVKNFNNGKVIHSGKNLSEQGNKQFEINKDYYPDNWINYEV
tara:strand:+ start:1082 stop:1930 length:849 start_codon:yes stop_codon:yes gene_type:complete